MLSITIAGPCETGYDALKQNVNKSYVDFYKLTTHRINPHFKNKQFNVMLRT